MGKNTKNFSLSLDDFNTASDNLTNDTIEQIHNEIKQKEIKQKEIKQEREQLTEQYIQSSKKLNKIQKANLGNPKIKEGTSKEKNYAITFKIDADIEDYLKNIMWVQYNKGIMWIQTNDDTKKNLNKNYYINDLIRKDMIDTLGLKENATTSEIQTAWLDYKQQHNIK